MTWDHAKDLAEIIGVALALLTLLKSLVEYKRQGAQKRAEQFLVMRQRFKDNVDFKQMCDLLETDHFDLRKISFKEKRDLLGFFEEVALLTNTGLIKTTVAHYMLPFSSMFRSIVSFRGRPHMTQEFSWEGVIGSAHFGSKPV